LQLLRLSLVREDKPDKEGNTRLVEVALFPGISGNIKRCQIFVVDLEDSAHP
jgi:hypothetical protein